ncbi:hypothetical protein BBD42_29975 [Paenibacillus sp. BIHB 4019]|uniref:Uncharacterized protein n=1 Tax=Paenibacillus sp. BIHB 4019 TaxID=1870819 RepID=A0A1B2DRB8_9BACL|nr:hypothetical protein [Paenibacillus sp. BIHB 4019]ANY70259.1 hypothetical protein BBD42_29975 [Paenibacillus sp. BIHB 4019]
MQQRPERAASQMFMACCSFFFRPNGMSETANIRINPYLEDLNFNVDHSKDASYTEMGFMKAFTFK